MGSVKSGSIVCHTITFRTKIRDENLMNWDLSSLGQEDSDEHAQPDKKGTNLTKFQRFHRLLLVAWARRGISPVLAKDELNTLVEMIQLGRLTKELASRCGE